MQAKGELQCCFTVNFVFILKNILTDYHHCSKYGQLSADDEYSVPQANKEIGGTVEANNEKHMNEGLNLKELKNVASIDEAYRWSSPF